MKMEHLPDHLIHKIMHLLPYEEAANFSVLSKSFYSYWLSFPTLNFSYKSSHSDDISYQTFFNTVQKNFRLRGPHIKGSLHSLSLSYVDISNSIPSSSRKMGRSYSDSYRQVFDVLLNFAEENNVKEINFDTGSYSDSYIQVFNERKNINNIKLTLDTLLPLFSSQFLTVLKLTGIEIPPVDACIKCPELTQLLINSCDGFRTINVSSSSSLKRVEVKCCNGLRAFHILGGKSLQSFEFQGSHCGLPPCTMDISDCLALRVLKLTATTAITDEWLNQTIRGLSYLEELHICHCNLLEKIEFENYSLKKFTLWGCLKQKEVVADVPNLLEFNFGGYITYPISILSAKCKGHFAWPCGKLNRVLSCFDHSKDLHLSCSIFEDMIVPRYEMQLNNLKHLKLEATNQELPRGRALTEFLESLLWLMPQPWTITFYSQISRKTHTLNFEYGQKLESKNLKVGKYCNDVPIKCWRHYDLKVKLEGFYNYEKYCLKKFFANSLLSYLHGSLYICLQYD